MCARVCVCDCVCVEERNCVTESARGRESEKGRYYLKDRSGVDGIPDRLNPVEASKLLIKMTFWLLSFNEFKLSHYITTLNASS